VGRLDRLLELGLGCFLSRGGRMVLGRLGGGSQMGAGRIGEIEV
jgi:hypothetical protein